MRSVQILAALAALIILTAAPAPAAGAGQQATDFQHSIVNVGLLEPVASVLKVKVGDPLPDFSLPSIDGTRVSREDFLGKKTLVLSFIPAAWTAVCSSQWPGYNILKPLFERQGAALVGVSTDPVPSLHAWITQMGGLWFPVLSDFWPHGAFASSLGILRPEGICERTLLIADKRGIIRYIDVHDINTRPDLGAMMRALQALP